MLHLVKYWNSASGKVTCVLSDDCPRGDLGDSGANEGDFADFARFVPSQILFQYGILYLNSYV